MPIIENVMDINLPRKEVYRIAQDYSVRFKWDPFPDKLEMIGNEGYKPKIGGKVFIRSKLGMEMIVEFVQVNPPRADAIKMISGPWFLEKFAGSWSFDFINEQMTRVRFRYLLKTRGYVFNYLIEKIAVRYFRHITKKRLHGLRTYCELKSL